MKALFAITVLIISASVTWVTADVKVGDAWYNASGKVVKVTPVQKEKERFVPGWEKREAVRNSGREGRWDRGYSRGWVERTRSRYYGGYGYGNISQLILLSKLSRNRSIFTRIRHNKTDHNNH